MEGKGQKASQERIGIIMSGSDSGMEEHFCVRHVEKVCGD